MRAPIKTAIEREGQPYVDRPVHIRPKQVSALAATVAQLLDPRGSVPRAPPPIVVGFERQPLRWRVTRGKRAKAARRKRRGK